MADYYFLKVHRVYRLKLRCGSWTLIILSFVSILDWAIIFRRFLPVFLGGLRSTLIGYPFADW